jgi:2-methylcitrate dehydratase PrpD
MDATRCLAEFVHRSRWEALPQAVRHESVRVFVNWVGGAFGGARHPAVSSCLAMVQALNGPPQATALGLGQRLDLLGATLVNGLSASAHAFDDTHLSSIGHPSAPTVAALLAYAELHPVSGQDFLHALILSNEVQTRLSRALTENPGNCHVGLYMTGLTGAAGVAAGIGKLLGLDVRQLVWAIGIGACQGGGFRASHASMCSGFIPANAGRNGLLAALLAAKDFTCNDNALETRNGFLDVFGAPANLPALTAGLGEQYECMNIAAKPFPAGCFIHPSIEACLDLAQAHQFDSADVEAVELEVHKLAIGLTGKPEPAHAYDAQVSVYHWAAAVLSRRAAGLAEAADSCVTDPAVVALRKRVNVKVVDELGADEARATVHLRNGRRLHTAIGPCLGSAERPMTDAQIETKFLQQTQDVLGDEAARRLVGHCWRMPDAAAVHLAAPGFWG